jgi:hypothetical protein
VHGEHARGTAQGPAPMSLSRSYFSLADAELVEAAAARGCFRAGTGVAVRRPDYGEGGDLGRVKR